MLITFSGCSSVGKTESVFTLDQYLKNEHGFSTKKFMEHEFSFEFKEENLQHTFAKMIHGWDKWGPVPLSYQLAYWYNNEIKTLLENEPHTFVMVDTSIYQCLYDFMHNQEIEKILHVSEFLELPIHNDRHHKHFYLDAPLTHIQQRKTNRADPAVDWNHETRIVKSYKNLCELGYLIEIDASGSEQETRQNVCNHLDIF